MVQNRTTMNRNPALSATVASCNGLVFAKTRGALTVSSRDPADSRACARSRAAESSGARHTSCSIRLRRGGGQDSNTF